MKSVLAALRHAHLARPRPVETVDGPPATTLATPSPRERTRGSAPESADSLLSGIGGCRRFNCGQVSVDKVSFHKAAVRNRLTKPQIRPGPYMRRTSATMLFYLGQEVYRRPQL